MSKIRKEECPGVQVGVGVLLYNGLSGFISRFDVSDNPVPNLKERVHKGMMLHARIEKIDVEKVSVRLVSRSSGTSYDRVLHWSCTLNL